MSQALPFLLAGIASAGALGALLGHALACSPLLPMPSHAPIMRALTDE